MEYSKSMFWWIVAGMVSWMVLICWWVGDDMAVRGFIHNVTTKPLTAMMGVSSCIGGCSISKWPWITTVCSLWTMMSSLNALACGFCGLSYSMLGDQGIILTPNIGIPSHATLLSFVLIAITQFGLAQDHKANALPGYLLLVIASSCLLGIVLGIPFLQFYWEGWSAAMALPTMVITTASGIAIIHQESRNE